MKIFEFKYTSGETDWIFAKDLEQAKGFYLGLTDCGDLDGYSITDIPEKEWANMSCFDPDESEPDESDPDYKVDYPNGHDEDEYSCGYKIMYTFAEYVAGAKSAIPDIIATTEY